MASTTTVVPITLSDARLLRNALAHDRRLDADFELERAYKNLEGSLAGPHRSDPTVVWLAGWDAQALLGALAHDADDGELDDVDLMAYQRLQGAFSRRTQAA